MKHLYLLRHAKSSWDDPGLSDFERPLAPRGKRATQRLAAHIRERGYEFDLVVCSAARRAADTWRWIASALNIDTTVSEESGLYLAGSDKLMARLRKVDDGVENVLLVAHNPDMEVLAARLCRDGEADALRRIGEKYPTGGLAAIRLDCARWADLCDDAGFLQSFVVPRSLAGN